MGFHRSWIMIIPNLLRVNPQNCHQPAEFFEASENQWIGLTKIAVGKGF